MVRDSDGTARTLRPDRVVVSPDRSRIIVIDYKTARPSTLHTDQVQTYMRHISDMYPQARVEGHLWYILTGDIDDISPSEHHATT